MTPELLDAIMRSERIAKMGRYLEELEAAANKVSHFHATGGANTVAGMYDIAVSVTTGVDIVGRVRGQIVALLLERAKVTEKEVRDLLSYQLPSEEAEGDGYCAQCTTPEDCALGGCRL